jgi:hypothetical protein
MVLAYQRHWAASAPLRQRLWSTARTLAPAVLAPLGAAAYMLYLGIAHSNPFLFAVMEQRAWGRHLAPPWEGLVGAVRGVFASSVPTLNVTDLIFTLLPLAILAIGWKRLPLHYSLFAASLALLALLEPLRMPEPLASVPRYLMTAFSIIIVCALYGRSPRFDRVYLSVTSAMLALNVVLFTTHHWVA